MEHGAVLDRGQAAENTYLLPRNNEDGLAGVTFYSVYNAGVESCIRLLRQTYNPELQAEVATGQLPETIGRVIGSIDTNLVQREW